MSAPFISRIEDAAVKAGWLKLSNGAYITRLALIDTSKPNRFARLPHSVALPNGWRLPTQGELVELKLHALVIRPFTLPTVAMLHAAGIPQPWTDAHGKDTPAMSSYRAQHIRSEEWCSIHDSEVWARMAAVGWAGEPIFNDGKHWGQGGAIFGWDSIQQWSYAHKHDTTYTDYATTIHAVSDIRPEGTISQPPIATMLGARGPAVLAWQRHLIAEGFTAIVADGIHGSKTEAATVEWRQRTEPAPVSPIATPSPTPAIPSLVLATIPYRAARIQYAGWPYGAPLGVCLHTSENTEHPSGAEVLQGTASRDDSKVSWHYAVDNNSITQSVPLTARAACAAPGNDRWIHIELFGRAGQGVAGWADAYSDAQLTLAARLVHALCDRFDAPIRRLSIEEVLRSDVRGICGHSDISSACMLARQRDIRRRPWHDGIQWRVTNHGDPGPTFPWDAFLSMARSAT